MTKGYHTPCDGAEYWPTWACPSSDARCLGCHQRPVPPAPDVEIVAGGWQQLSREMVRALARALGVRRSGDGLPDGQVERILEKWIELRHYGGARGAEVGTRSHEEPGALLWVATVDAKVWREGSELVQLSADEWQPAVYLVAMLRYYELPLLVQQAEATDLASTRGGGPCRVARQYVDEARGELVRLVKTSQYQAAMRRLAVEFAACPWDFLRVALGASLTTGRS